MNEALVGIAKFFVDQILSVPAYLVGIIVAIGLIALKKGVGVVVSGGLKATLGFMILGAGANVVVGALAPLGKLIQGATGMKGVVPSNEAISAIAQTEFGSQTAWVMVGGFLVSLLIARLTPLKYVFLTGHHMLFMGSMIVVLLATGGIPSAAVVIVGIVLLATIMTVMPAFSQPWTRRVTGGNSLAMGHFGSAGYIAAGAVGQLVGKKSKSTEDMKIPDGLRFLRDSMIATALSMVLFYFVFTLWALASMGPESAFKVLEATSTGDFLMKGLANGLVFGVGLAIILYGVRTMLGEIVPAFQGISAKVVPGAMPALDCPVVFPYAPNAVLIGFISSFVGGVVSFMLLAAVLGPHLGLALILPGMAPHFFTGGAAGVYGNATGGRRGAVLGAFTNGVIISILPAILLPLLGVLGFADTTYGDADLAWYGVVLGSAVRIPGHVVAILVLVLIAALLIGCAILFQKRTANWTPGGEHAAWVAELKEQEKAAAAAAKAAKAGEEVKAGEGTKADAGS